MRTPGLLLLCFVDAILKTIILQGRVATRFRCGEIYQIFIENCLLGPAVKESVKSINIWWRYEQEFGA